MSKSEPHTIPEPVEGKPKMDESREPEQDAASWYQWPMYSWVSPMLERGSDRIDEGIPLPVEDLLKMPEVENPVENAQLLQQYWNEELEREEPSLSRALRRAFWPRVAVGGVLRLMSDASAFGLPFMLRGFVQWLQDPNSETWLGIVWVVCITLLNVIMSVCLNAASHHTMTGMQQMRSAIVISVFEAGLRFPAGHKEIGKITSTHASDSMKFLEFGMFIHGMWVSPLLVLAAIVALYFFVGWAGVIVVAFMIFFVPVQGCAMGRVMALRGELMKFVDKRIKFLNEMLQGIRICKFMTWEESFADRVRDAREEEVKVITHQWFFRLIAMTIMQSLPMVVTFVIFSVYYGLEGEMKADDVFPALTMVNAIRMPLLFIPMSFAKLVEMNVSLERIQSVLTNGDRREYVEREQSENATNNDSASQPAIQLENATVLGTGGVTILDDISVNFPKGKLTIVLGPTGSGKSTLINATVGEASVSETTRVIHRGTVAYVPQEAWIMNATVRNNILMTKEFDEEKYIDVLLSCQLMSDLSQLQGSDQTEIGERGINLSGGQKQRIALARAAYSDRDIILMDDPLSAVDPHVCEGLFVKCINGDALKDKTRVLVTHQVQFLPHADHVIAMKDCKIAFQGTYEEFQSSDIDAESLVEPKVEEAVAENPSITSAQGKDAASEAIANVKPNEGSDQAMDSAAAVPSREIPKGADNSQMTKEDAAYGEVAWSTYGWYLKLGGVALMVITLLINLCWQGCVILANIFLAFWTTKRNFAGHQLSDEDYLMWFGICVLGSIIFQLLRQQTYRMFVISVSRNVHNTLATNILNAPTSFFDTTPMGRIMNRFTKDIEMIDNNIPEASNMLLNMVFMVLGMLFIVAFSAPYLIVIFPVLGIIFRIMYKHYAKTVRGIKRLDGIYRSPMMSIVNEAVGGLASIRAYGIVEDLKRDHEKRCILGMRPMYCVRAAQRWLSARAEMLGSTIVFFVALFAWLMKSWDLGLESNPGVAALALTFAIATTNTITFLTRVFADLETDMSATERVKEYSDGIECEKQVEYGTGPEECPPPAQTWPEDGSIEFADVDLRYRDNLPLVLKGVTFKATSGQKVGIVGRTGSGKSTVMLALFRMVEICAGTIRLSGHDISTLKMQDLRRNITIIPQDPVLFTGTIRSNLDPFGRHSDDVLWKSIVQIGLENRLNSGKEEESNGLDSIVTARGENFSVGQRQLLCLARALLKKSRILLLDEATASVDFETDALIQRAIRTEFAECTVLTIAHRLKTVIDNDRILVLDQGNVMEFDSPFNLLQKPSGQFRDMVNQLGEEQAAELAEVAREHQALLSGGN